MKTQAERVVGQTMRLIRATNVGQGAIILYKTPGRPKVKSSYTVVTLDQDGLEVESWTFRSIRRLVDAERFYNWTWGALSTNEKVS